MKHLLLMMAGLLMWTACSDNNEDPSDPIPDMSEDMPDMTDAPEDMPVCMPKTTCDAGVCGQVDDGCGGTLDCGQPMTECPVGMCGQIDDGCGGTLDCGAPKTCAELGCGTHDDGCGMQIDCGACLCENGQPVSDSCGPCNMGQTECQAGANEGSCSVESIPLLDGLDAQACAERLIYVDAGAMLGGDGSRQKPHRLISIAMDEAKFGDIVILANNRTFNEPVNAKDGVHILGGFDHRGESWTYNGVATFIEVEQGRRPIALMAKDITNPTHIEDLNIRGADAGDNESAVGLWAERASSLSLKRVVIHSGHGGQGSAGTDGVDGSDGVNGDSGKPGAVGSHQSFPTNNARPTGGNGGVNPECLAASGGKGADATGRMGNQLLFEHGQDAASLIGSEGKGGSTLTQALLYPNNDQQYPLSGSDGHTGTIGAVGGDGQPGFKWDGKIIIEGTGLSGGAGGHGGGGGGGGAHALYTYYNLYSAFDADPYLIWSWSPTGGGGGTGGCGGTGGTGGKVGGGAFGAVIIDGNPTLSDMQITGGAGGNGGTGGFGGLGGQPGFGGAGASTTKIYNGIVGGTTPGGTRPGNGTGIISAPMYLQSGNGGNGGYGAEGGNGGNGAGGPTVGIWCVNAKPVMERFNARASGPGLGAVNAPAGERIDNKGCDQ